MINQTTNITVPSSLWQANYEGDVEPSVEVLVDTADGLQKMLPRGVTINSGLVSVNFSSPQTGKLILVKAGTQTFVGPVVRLGGDAVIGSNTTSTTPGTSGPWAGIPVFGPWTWREGNPVPTSGPGGDEVEPEIPVSGTLIEAYFQDEGPIEDSVQWTLSDAFNFDADVLPRELTTDTTFAQTLLSISSKYAQDESVLPITNLNTSDVKVSGVINTNGFDANSTVFTFQNGEFVHNGPSIHMSLFYYNSYSQVEFKLFPDKIETLIKAVPNSGYQDISHTFFGTNFNFEITVKKNQVLLRITDGNDLNALIRSANDLVLTPPINTPEYYDFYEEYVLYIKSNATPFTGWPVKYLIAEVIETFNPTDPDYAPPLN